MDLVRSPKASTASRHEFFDRVRAVEQNPTVVVSQSSAEVGIELTVLLPRITAEQLRQRGALRGISGSTLASELLVAVARDGLYDAVIDAG